MAAIRETRQHRNSSLLYKYALLDTDHSGNMRAVLTLNLMLLFAFQKYLLESAV